MINYFGFQLILHPKQEQIFKANRNVRVLVCGVMYEVMQNKKSIPALTPECCKAAFSTTLIN